MFGWLKRLIARKQLKDLQKRTQLRISGQVASMNTDALSEEEKTAFYNHIRDKTGYRTFNGRVEHAYSKEFTGQTKHCPRCKQRTEQLYAEFLYEVAEGTRLMCAPAGYFCARCPTVIVDEALIQAGVTQGYHYEATVGIYDARQKTPMLFQTWNGRPLLFWLDDDVGLYFGESDTWHTYTPQQYRKIQRKRKMQRASRKRNRR